MNKDLNLIIGNEEDQEKFVQIPIKRKQFGDFITNLLGQPEVISEKKLGSFEISYEWMLHIHALIDQRINQQAHSDLVDFSAAFKYRDAPSRKVTTIEAFLNFNESKIVTTASVRLVWTYLVNFPNKSAPEKQEIILNLSTETTETIRLRGTSSARQTIDETGAISYHIFHTARTWGDDIQTLLDKEVSKLFPDEKWYDEYLEKTIFFVALSFFVAGFLVPDLIEQLIREHQIAQLFTEFFPDGGKISELSQDNKLTLALQLLDPTNQLHKVDTLYRGVSFIAGLGLAFFTIFTFQTVKPSHIIVTEEDKKRQSECRKKENWGVYKDVLKYFLAVTAGVAGNYAYYFLTR